MKINNALLYNILRFSEKVPMRTPHRFQLILQYTDILWSHFCGETDLVNILDENDGIVFSPCELLLSKILENSKSLYPHELKVVDYDLVLVPTKDYCCGRLIKIDGRHFSSATLYTENGVLTARSFKGYCKCGKVYHHGYEEDKKGNTRTYDENWTYFMVSTVIGFSEKMLHTTDMQISIGVVSLESATSIYNNVHDTKGKPLMPDRLESGWFVYKTSSYYHDFTSWPRKSGSKEFDLERFCVDNYERIRRTIDAKWLQHVCDEPGCKERLIVIDGNEKCYRMICSAKKEKIQGSKGEVNSYQICINNPKRGNQFTKASKFCELHHKDQSNEIDEVKLDLRPRTRLFCKTFPEFLTSNEGCKEETTINKFYDRTAGMFYIFRSCGIRLSHWEMYTNESLSSVFTYLIDLFGDKPSDFLSGIVYDRACDLHPFIKRLANEGNEQAKVYQFLNFVVDIFHAEKHTQPKCVLGNDQCQYHPHLDKFKHFREMNTEIAEQSFSRINPFKYITRKMSYAKRLMFLKFIDDNSNNMRLKKCKY